MSNRVNEYVFCPSCGSITTPGVCTQCGYRLNQESVENVQSFMPEQEQNQPYSTGNYYQPEMQPDNFNGNQYSQPADASVYHQYSGQPQYTSVPNAPIQPEKKKSRWWLWLLIIAGILFLGAFLVVVVMIAIFVLVPVLTVDDTVTSTQVAYPQTSMTQEIETSEPSEEYSEENVTTEEWEDYYVYDSSSYAVYAADHTRYDFSDFDWDSYASADAGYSDTTDGTNDFYLLEDSLSSFGSDHTNHYGEAFIGDYYEPFVECIDSNQAYGLERHFMSYSDSKDGVDINSSIAYMQFTGGTIPNEEELNLAIMNATANDLFAYLDGKKTYDVMQSLYFFVDSFVVYNDAEKVSILLDVVVVGDASTYADSYVYAINISTKTGEILDNSEFISVDEEFAAEFRERCCTQNGTDIEGLNSITDAELATMLGDEKTNIVFFSPYGLEFGYNYEMGSPEGYSRGWMTITMKDWMNYTETLGEIVTMPENSGASQISGATDM